MQEKITTLEMEEALARHFGYRQNIIVPNISFGFNIHECDLLILRKSGHALEVEIKISRSDLKKDLKKEHNHNDYFNRIKELWFAIPDYLQDSIAFIPDHAGIIVVYQDKWSNKFFCKTVREARANTNAHKLDTLEQLALARLGTMRIWNLKRKILDMKKPRKRFRRDKFQYNLQFADANIT